MKNYKEMADSVLNRRDEYVVEKRKRMKKLTTSISCFCLCALLGAGVWQSGILNGDVQSPISTEQVGTLDNSPNTQGEQKQPAISNNENNPSVGDDKAAADVQGRVVWNGADYIQIDIVSEEQVELGEYLGEVADFEGPYKDAGVVGGLYTVKGSETLLCAKLDGRFFDNGDYVLLEKLH